MRLPRLKTAVNPITRLFFRYLATPEASEQRLSPTVVFCAFLCDIFPNSLSSNLTCLCFQTFVKHAFRAFRP